LIKLIQARIVEYQQINLNLQFQFSKDGELKLILLKQHLKKLTPITEELYFLMNLLHGLLKRI